MDGEGSGETQRGVDLTDEEHQARAMLMGMEYNKDLGWYRKLDEDGMPTRLDAVTLEVIDWREAQARIKALTVREVHRGVYP